MIEQQEDLEGKVVSTGQAVSFPRLGGASGKVETGQSRSLASLRVAYD